MTKQYLKKNINMFLLVVILICIGSLMAISTYYGQRYRMITENYEEIEGKFENLTLDLTSKSNELTLCRGNLNQTSTDVDKYDSLYSEKVDELEQKGGELSACQNNYENTKKSLVDKTNELKSEQDKNKQILLDLATANEDLDDCKSLKLDYKGDLNDCEDLCPNWEGGAC